VKCSKKRSHIVLAIILALFLVSVALRLIHMRWYSASLRGTMEERPVSLCSNGSCNLDKPHHKSRGAVMVVRLWGKQTEAAIMELFASLYRRAGLGFVLCRILHWNREHEGNVRYGVWRSYSAMTAAQYTYFDAQSPWAIKNDIDFTFNTAVAKAREISLLTHWWYDMWTVFQSNRNFPARWGRIAFICDIECAF
jgi:hypothetical protein